jgi:hypothetical protein
VTCFFWGPADSFWFSESCFDSTELRKAEANNRSDLVYLEKVLPDDPWFFLRWSFPFAWLQPLYLVKCGDSTSFNLQSHLLGILRLFSHSGHSRWRWPPPHHMQTVVDSYVAKVLAIVTLGQETVRLLGFCQECCLKMVFRHTLPHSSWIRPLAEQRISLFPLGVAFSRPVVIYIFRSPPSYWCCYCLQSHYFFFDVCCGA